MTDTTKLTAARQLLARYGEAAWLLTNAKRATIDDAGPVIYICDVESGRVLLLETVAGALQTLSDQADLDETAYEKIRAALSILIDDLLNSSAGIHPDTRRGVILGATFCITETRGFDITKHQGAGVQYLLLRYPDIGAERHVLTPMPIFKAHPVTTAELDATVSHVLSSERFNFPERFAPGQAVRFKESRRNVLGGGL
jgi:hypothetical protein